MNAGRLYLRYLGISCRSQMQYRASFLMLSLGNFLVSGLEILSIYALFARFGSLRGWRLAEVALFYGIINVAFALAEAFSRGFDIFSNLIRSGDFDRLLLRPRTTVLQVASQEVQLMRIGRLSQGMIVLVWAASALDVHWTAGRAALTLFAVLGGSALFCGLFVLQATMCFWTTESLEIWNTITYGGTETGQYPLTVYRPWFRKFFTFVVPLAAVTYFPALAVLGRPDSLLGSPLWFQCACPALGIMFLAGTMLVWRFGVSHYRSTGS